MNWLIFGMLVFCCLSLVIMLFCLKDIDDRIDFTRQEYNSMYNYVRSTNDIVRSNLLPNFDKMLVDYKKKIESEKSRLEKRCPYLQEDIRRQAEIRRPFSQ